jgi:hypothetical protein
MKKILLLTFVITALISGCNKEDLSWNLPRNNPNDVLKNDTSRYQGPNNNLSLATLTTSPVSSITQTTVITGGNITNEGSSSVIARGVCYSSSQNPTTSNFVANSGNGGGSFTSTLSGLSPNTTYYIRSFATNAIGTAYGNQIAFSTSQLPNNTCNVSATTNGSTFIMQTSSQSYFTQGESYPITMYSSVFDIGQVNNIKLYDGNLFIYSFGNWIVFTNNTKNLILPHSIPVSNCYNIRVEDGSDLYVSPNFTILP